MRHYRPTVATLTTKGVPLAQSNAQEDLVVSTSGALAAATTGSTTVDVGAVVGHDRHRGTVGSERSWASTPTSTHVEVLTGTAEANSTVAVFDGATKLGHGDGRLETGPGAMPPRALVDRQPQLHGRKRWMSPATPVWLLRRFRSQFHLHQPPQVRR